MELYEMTMTDETSHVLQQLLDANRRFALSAKGTTNHCPMALVALAKMGASAQRLQGFFDMWEEKYALPAAKIGAPVARDEWQLALGQAERFEALQQCLLAWIEQDGVQAVLTEVLSKIPFAPGTSAFHALIRLAYGLEAQHHREIAAGLACLISRNLPIAVDFATRPMLESARQGLDRLSQAMAGGDFSGGSIVTSLRAVAADPRFIPALAAVPFTPRIFKEMAALAIELYWQSKNFTVLHMVTGMHAARVLFAHLPPDLVTRLMPELWAAFCAAYVSVGAPLLPASLTLGMPISDKGEAEQWLDLMAAAVESNDDHVIKLCYSCWQENDAVANPLYLAAASRLLPR
jgi:hypothetical protein